MSNVTNRQWPHAQAPAGWPTTTNAAQPTTQPYPVVRMPTVSPAAAEILRDAVWHIDAAEHQASGASAKTVRNLGWGGSALNARCGSTTVADTNDPLFLPFYGTPYVYLPGLAGNSLTCTAPATATQYLATALDGTTASGAATGGAAFTFSMVGSWATVSLLDAGNAVLASFVGASLTAGSATAQTDAYAVAWAINRATSGRKSVAVVAPVWLFGTDDQVVVRRNPLLDFDQMTSFVVVTVSRHWPSNSNQWIIGNSYYAPGWYVAYSNAGGILGVVRGTPDSGGDPQVNVNLIFVLQRSVQNRTISEAGYVTKDKTPGGVNSLSQMQIGHDVTGAYAYADMEFMSAAIFRRALSAAEIATLTSYYTGKYR